MYEFYVASVSQLMYPQVVGVSQVNSKNIFTNYMYQFYIASVLQLMYLQVVGVSQVNSKYIYKLHVSILYCKCFATHVSSSGGCLSSE